MYVATDLLRVDLDDRFSESRITLLLGMVCLYPSDYSPTLKKMTNFEEDEVLAMAQLYPDHFEIETKMEHLS
jgi:hypothetical protein